MIRKSLSLWSLIVIFSSNIVFPMDPNRRPRTTTTTTTTTSTAAHRSQFTESYNTLNSTLEESIRSGNIEGLLRTMGAALHRIHQSISGTVPADFSTSAPRAHRDSQSGYNAEQFEREEAEHYDDGCEKLTTGMRNIAITHSPDKIRRLLTAIYDNHTSICTKILFFGVPGTGKTTLSYAIAQALRNRGFKSKYFKGTQIEGPVRRSGERNLSTAFSPTRGAVHNGIRQPASSDNKWVIIIDELDSIMAEAKESQEKGTDRGAIKELSLALNTILWNTNIVVIGITNNLDALPETIASRFKENTIEIELPNDGHRKDLIKYHLNAIKNKLAPECLVQEIDQQTRETRNVIDESFLTSLVRETNGLSVRDIAEAIHGTGINTVELFDVSRLPNETEPSSDETLALHPVETSTSTEQARTPRPILKEDIRKALKDKQPPKQGWCVWILSGVWSFTKDFGKEVLAETLKQGTDKLAGGIVNGVSRKANATLSERFDWWPGKYGADHEQYLRGQLLEEEVADLQERKKYRDMERTLLKDRHDDLPAEKEDRERRRTLTKFAAADAKPALKRAVRSDIAQQTSLALALLNVAEKKMDADERFIVNIVAPGTDPVVAQPGFLGDNNPAVSCIAERYKKEKEKREEQIDEFDPNK